MTRFVMVDVVLVFVFVAILAELKSDLILRLSPRFVFSFKTDSRRFHHRGKMIKSVKQTRLSSMVALITRWQPNY